MIVRKLKKAERDQSGLTLLEMIVAILMTTIIAAAAIATIFQLIAWNSKTNTSLIANTQVESAVSWISRDIQSAKKVETNGSFFPLTLTSIDFNGVLKRVDYIIVGDELRRIVNSGTPLVVARYSDPASTTFIEVLDPNTGERTGVINFTIKVTVPGFRSTTVIRESRIYHRTDLL